MKLTNAKKIREYVLKESFADVGMLFDKYNKEHPVHGFPNISLVYIINDELNGSVKLDKKFERLNMPNNEIRLALFA